MVILPHIIFSKIFTKNEFSTTACINHTREKFQEKLIFAEFLGNGQSDKSKKICPILIKNPKKNNAKCYVTCASKST